MNRETRYYVFKLKDVENWLLPSEQHMLAAIQERLNYGRECVAKAPLKCVVVESDWPEYEPTWKAIEKRMDLKDPKNQCSTCMGDGELMHIAAGYICPDCGGTGLRVDNVTNNQPTEL